MKKKPLTCEDVISELEWARCQGCKDADNFRARIRDNWLDYRYLDYRRLMKESTVRHPCEHAQDKLRGLQQRKRRKERLRLLDSICESWVWFIMIWLAALLVALAVT